MAKSVKCFCSYDDVEAEVDLSTWNKFLEMANTTVRVNHGDDEDPPEFSKISEPALMEMINYCKNGEGENKSCISDQYLLGLDLKDLVRLIKALKYLGYEPFYYDVCKHLKGISQEAFSQKLLTQDGHSLLVIIQDLKDLLYDPYYSDHVTGLLPIEPLVSALVKHMRGSQEEISKIIPNFSILTLLDILKAAKLVPGLEHFYYAVVKHVEGQTQDKISQALDYLTLIGLLRTCKVSQSLGLESLRPVLISRLKSKDSMHKLTDLLDDDNLMPLIKLMKLATELPFPMSCHLSQLLEETKLHIEERSSGWLKESIINLDVRDLMRVFEVSKLCSMRKLRIVVIRHLVAISKDELSKKVGTKVYPRDKRDWFLRKAKKVQNEYQVLLDEKRNEAAGYKDEDEKEPSFDSDSSENSSSFWESYEKPATNDDFFEKWKTLFQELVLPKLEDRAVIRFGIACKAASKLVDSQIRSRGIILRNGLPLQVNDVKIKLENHNGLSVDVGLTGSLASSILCAKRVQNIERFGQEIQVTHHVGLMDDKILELVGKYFEAASSEDYVNRLEKWAVEHLEDGRNIYLLGLIQAAQDLEMKGLLVKLAEHMAKCIRGIQVGEMRKIFGFREEQGLEFDYGSLPDIRPFLELMIPMLNDDSYQHFAAMDKACVPLLNEVQARACSFQVGERWRIYLVCTNGKEIKPSKAVIAMSGLIRNKMIDKSSKDALKIDLQATTEIVLHRIDQYCEVHATHNVKKAQQEILTSLEDYDANTLFHIAEGAMEMKIRILVDLVSQTLAAMINNKTVWEMRASFNLKNDLKSYEEHDWRHKHEWAFESDPLPAISEPANSPLPTGNVDLVECLCSDNEVVRVDLTTWEKFLKLADTQVRVPSKEKEAVGLTKFSKTAIETILDYCRSGEGAISDRNLLGLGLNNLAELEKAICKLYFVPLYSMLDKLLEGISEKTLLDMFLSEDVTNVNLPTVIKMATKRSSTTEPLVSALVKYLLRNSQGFSLITSESKPEVSPTILKADLHTLLKILKAANGVTSLEPFYLVWVDYLVGKSQEEIADMSRNEDLINLFKIYKVSESLGLTTLCPALISLLKSTNSMHKLTAMLREDNLMSLIKLMEAAYEMSCHRQMFEDPKSHIEGKSIEDLEEAMLHFDLGDIIKIVGVSQDYEMPKLHNVVIGHLIDKSEDELSKMVGTKVYSRGKRNLFLREAKKVQRVYRDQVSKKKAAQEDGDEDPEDDKQAAQEDEDASE